MPNMAVGAIQNQQPRFVSFRHGMLRNQFGRQGKIEIGGSHRNEFRVSDLKFQAVKR
jgi:hypothetical protein